MESSCFGKSQELSHFLFSMEGTMHTWRKPCTQGGNHAHREEAMETGRKPWTQGESHGNREEAMHT